MNLTVDALERADGIVFIGWRFAASVSIECTWYLHGGRHGRGVEAVVLLLALV